MNENEKAELIAAAAEIDTSDVVGMIIDHESGNLDNAATVALFQSLVNSGLAWTLQGVYGRAAESLINMGLVSPA